MTETAEKMGIELFVLDGGWFGKRVSEHSGLGDWIANPERLPDGIAGLAQKIEQLGMKFGLWFEPEMVNKDSDLYRVHPDWLYQVSVKDHFGQRKLGEFYGDELMNAGIPLNDRSCEDNAENKKSDYDFQSKIYLLQ